MKRGTFLVLALALAGTIAHAQTDSLGAYIMAGDSAVEVKMVKPSQNRTTSVVVASKSSLVFDGETSPYRAKGTAVFRLHYGIADPARMAKYFMFSPSFSAEDMTVAKFTVRKGNRLLQNSSASVLGSSIGAKKAEVEIERRGVAEGVYEVRVTGEPGEYCLVPVMYGMAVGNSGVFPFTIE